MSSHTRRFLLLGTLACALVASPLAAQDKRELKLLPPFEPGFEEEIALVGSLASTDVKNADDRSELKATFTRRVQALKDGLPTDENLSFSRLRIVQHQANGDDVEWGAVAGYFGSATRSGKARFAQGTAFSPIAQRSPLAGIVLARDPDGLARAMQPSSPVAEKDSWDVEPKSLLHLFGPDGAKLVTDGTSAKATLDSLSEKKGAVEAKVKLEAVVVYREANGRDAPHSRLKLWATLRGPIDGSAPPRKETVEYQLLDADGSKQVVKYEIVRIRK